MKRKETDYLKNYKRKRQQEPKIIAQDDGRWTLFQVGKNYRLYYFDPSSSQLQDFVILTDAIIKIIKQSCLMGWYKS